MSKFLMNGVIMTPLQQMFVTRCYAANMVNTGITDQTKEYTQHLVDICSELIRDGLIDFSMSCEKDSFFANMDLEYMDDAACEDAYIDSVLTIKEFLAVRAFDHQAADGQAMYDLSINESPNDVWAEEMEQDALLNQYCHEQQEPDSVRAVCRPFNVGYKS